MSAFGSDHTHVGCNGYYRPVEFWVNGEPVQAFHSFFETYNAGLGIILTTGRREGVTEHPFTLFKRYPLASIPAWQFLLAVSPPLRAIKSAG